MAEWSGEPAYRQLAADLRARIRDGRLPVGEQLPSLADLMRQYDVSITVVRMALRELRAEGLVTTHQGKGSFVRSAEGASIPSPGSTEFQAVMRQLDLVQEHVQRLESRVAELEETVRGRGPQARKPRPRSGP
jgi:DNA-binding GntR family transcriptional regulator